MDKSNHMTIFIFIDDSRIIPSLSMFRNRTGPNIWTQLSCWQIFTTDSHLKYFRTTGYPIIVQKAILILALAFTITVATAVVVGLVAKIGGGNFVWNWIWPYTTNNGTYKQHVRDSFWTRLGDQGWPWFVLSQKNISDSCLEFCQSTFLDLT